jgi:hypothetical protein
MAISSKIEEIILEIAKNAGNISDAMTLGVGDVDIPSSAIFEINNLLSTAQTGYPYFGIVETNPLGFIPSYSFSSDQYNVVYGSGTISYNGSLIQLSQQKIPIKKEFVKDYNLVGSGSTAHKYGITVGIPISEAQKAIQTFNTTVSIASTSGSNILYVTSVDTATSLGFPLEAHVGSLYLKFSGVSGSGLVLDSTFYNGSSYGVLPSTVSVDTPVKFVFQPKLKYLTGFPIETTNENPISFNYYPPIPSTWIPVGKILIKNPEDPRVAGNSQDAFVRTANDIPTSTSSNLILGNTDDVQDVINSCNAAISNLNSYRNDIIINNFVDAIRSYSNELIQGTNLNANQFWSLQPFRPTQYYSKGVSFSGLERFEFPFNFTKAYYNRTAQDLQHTFAVFRGDLVSYNSAVLGTSGIGTSELTGTIITSSSSLSSLSPGTQIYGVTAVSAIAGTSYVETIPTYVSKVSTNVTNSNYMVELKWQGLGTTNALFYHIYKRPSLSTESTEKRLTLIDDIQNPPYSTIAPVTDNSFLNLDNKNTAFKVTANEDCYVGGVTLKLGFNAPNQVASSGSTGLNFTIYENSAGSPNYNSPLSDQPTLLYTDILEGSASYTVKFNPGVNLDANTSYWLVINKPVNFSTGLGTTSLRARILSSGSGQIKTLSTDFDGSSVWSSTGGSAYFQVRGYLDDGNTVGESFRRGIKFTNRIANTARRMSVYVPPIDDIVDDTGLIFNGSSVAIASTTNKTIKNELLVSVIAKYGTGGTEVTMTTTVPKGTPRDTRFLLGTETDLYDRVTNVIVSPGTDVTRVGNGPILWDIYDLITVETVP